MSGKRGKHFVLRVWILIAAQHQIEALAHWHCDCGVRPGGDHIDSISGYNQQRMAVDPKPKRNACSRVDQAKSHPLIRITRESGGGRKGGRRDVVTDIEIGRAHGLTHATARAVRLPLHQTVPHTHRGRAVELSTAVQKNGDGGRREYRSIACNEPIETTWRVRKAKE
jgi:hypothetical protein